MSVPPLAVSLLALTFALPAHADLAFGFDTGAQGWEVREGGALVHRSSGGAPGGYLEFTDLDSRDMLAVLQPGGADWSAYAGGMIRFDARILSDNAPDWPGFGEVALAGPGGAVVLDLVPAGRPLADGRWQHFSVPLSAFGAGLPAVLANVQTFSIKTEYSVSTVGVPASFEVLGLDNVAITAVPEPAHWALLLAGGVLLPVLRRRC